MTPEMQEEFPDFYEKACPKCGHVHLGKYKELPFGDDVIHMAAIECLCGHMFTVKRED